MARQVYRLKSPEPNYQAYWDTFGASSGGGTDTGARYRAWRPKRIEHRLFWGRKLSQTLSGAAPSPLWIHLWLYPLATACHTSNSSRILHANQLRFHQGIKTVLLTAWESISQIHKGFVLPPEKWNQIQNIQNTSIWNYFSNHDKLFKYLQLVTVLDPLQIKFVQLIRDKNGILCLEKIL